jgi:hypothetical protein
MWPNPNAVAHFLPSCLPSCVSHVAGSITREKIAAATIGSGLPIMSYFDVANSALKVAQCSDAACTGPARISVLDDSGSVGTRRTMLIDSNGLPRIVYQDLSASRVKIVQCATRSCP